MDLVDKLIIINNAYHDTLRYMNFKESPDDKTYFEHIHEVMKTLNWEWSQSGESHVPSVAEIIEVVDDLYKSVCRHLIKQITSDEIAHEVSSSCCTGGFEVVGWYYPDDVARIDIKFVLVSASNLD